MFVELRVTEERVHDLLCCAIEGGPVGFWATFEVEPAKGKVSGDYKYPHLEVPFDGGWLTIESIDQPREFEPKKLDQEAIRRGMQIFADNYPMSFARFMGQREDGSTGDLFLQCCLFGRQLFV